jgi:hypothetical protein
MTPDTGQTAAHEWVSFPGGQLEGRRPKALCPACREALRRQAAGRSIFPSRIRNDANPHAATRTLCFQCYRADLDRQRALAAAGALDTASTERFQYQLPFERVDTGRLELLKGERAVERGVLLQHGGRFADRRRRAQIAARHAMQRATAGGPSSPRSDARDSAIAAIHAAELQLPESWWPFVMSR